MILWNPGMGHWIGLRPKDMATLTLSQYLACQRFLEANG